MSATVEQARNEIISTFKTAWDAGAESTGLNVLYWDTEGEVPDSGAYARVTVRHATGEQTTVGSAAGKRRYERAGTVTVQIFTEHNEGGTLSDKLVNIIENAFRGVTTSPGRVIFRRVRTNEIGQDSQWFQVNVLADFEYDEIR